MNEYVFLNHGLVPAEEARISIFDAGLLHGVGLFETMRSYQGQIFRVEDHLDRLYHSAEALGILITQKRAELAEWLEVLLETNDLKDARLRLTATRGSLRQLPDDEQPESMVFATAAAMQPYPAEYYRRGMTVTLCPYRQNPFDPTSGHKSLNYFSRLVGLQQAQQQQAGEALWFTADGNLAEGCISNVFMVKQERLLTPTVETGILPGITRKVVMELATAEGMKIEEGLFSMNDLQAASEVFLTNSIMELMPVCRIDRQAIGKDKPGPIYKKLHELYQQAVQAECEGQDGLNDFE